MDNPTAPVAEYEVLRADLGPAGSICVKRRNLLCEDFSVDTSLFEQDYTVAASTGFIVWEGGWKLVEALQGQLLEETRGKLVVELGAGTGLAGLCAAALGAHVLVTDLPSVVVGSLSENIELNVSTTNTANGSRVPHWSGSQPIGPYEGTVAASPLDWTRPVDEQVSEGAVDPRPAEVILAAETVWLEELVEPFVRTVVEILKAPGADARARRKKCIISYRERTTDTSTSFAGAMALFSALRREGCSIDNIDHTFGPQIRMHCVQLAD